MHLLSFILMIVEKILKKYRLLLVCGNFVRSMPINVFYLTTLIYCIYKDRLNCKYSQDLEEFRYEMWIKYEIDTFFCWIYSTMIFLLFVYITKFNSNSKELDESLAIQDIWEGKNSKDILHYFKFESDFFSLCFGFLILDIIQIKNLYIDTETINNFFENESMYLTYFVVLRFYMTFLFVRNAKVSAQF